MKTLYLHCGYHKTGSSFLQTMFARNRDTLTESGYYFPYSDREYDMISGNISPGNGPELVAALNEADEEKTRVFLGRSIKEAEKKGCHILVISSEGLFHSFAKKSALDCLVNSCDQLGIKRIHGLVYFRDPISHAISTYKHRAKNGNINDFGEWLDQDYETMDLLSKFADYRSEYDITWTCRKYAADSEFMTRSAFVDWLGLSMPAIPQDDEVNLSLTLSEIQVIQTLKKIYPGVVDFLKEELRKLSSADKKNDKSLVATHKDIAAMRLQKHRLLVDKVNEYLADNEKLVLPQSESDIRELQDLEMILGEQQLYAIARAMIGFSKSDKMTTKIRDLSGKVAGKLNRLLIKR